VALAKDSRHVRLVEMGVIMDICFSGKFERHNKKSAGVKAVGAGLRVVEDLRTTTHYLMAAKLDTDKVKTAGRFGTRILTEAEFEEFVETGFPIIEAPGRASRPYEPPITWQRMIKPFDAAVEYADEYGVITNIRGRCFEEGFLKRNAGQTRYLRMQLADQSSRILSLREDRILSLKAA
jgi:hypothetical protein